MLNLDSLGLEPASRPKLEAPDRLNLPVIRAMEIPFRCANMGMTHQGPNSSEVIPFIQEGCGDGVTDHMRMSPFPNQRLLCH